MLGKAISIQIHRDIFHDAYWSARANSKKRIPAQHGLTKVAFPVTTYARDEAWPEYVSDVEEYARMRCSAQKQGRNTNLWRTPRMRLASNQWTRLSLVGDVTAENGGSISCRFVFYNYQRGNNAFVDDVMIVPITDAPLGEAR